MIAAPAHRSAFSQIIKPDADAPPALFAAQAAAGDPVGTVTLEVQACALTAWDRRDPPAGGWPRVPGGAIIGRAGDGVRWICGGFLPCGSCGPCRCGLLLGCAASVRPGWNAAGGLASHVTLPRRFLAPALPGDWDAAAAAAALASAGPTYQAVAAAGMAPGDTVVLVGDAGPGALPLALLAAAGMRPLWITDAPEELAPAGAAVVRGVPLASDLAATRYHVVDLAPGAASIASWSHLASGALSCTLVGSGPLPAAVDLDSLLGGAAALRWARDLHPDLALDVVALIASGRMPLAGRVAGATLPRMADRYARFLNGSPGAGWPVLVVDSPVGNANNP